jgi:hypothetical protein
MICQGRLVTSIFLFMTLSACGGSSHTGWQSLPVPIYADAKIVNSYQAMSDLKDAFNYWESRAGKRIFDFKGQWNGGAPYAGSPGQPTAILGNVIFFSNPWPYPANFVGMTTVENGSDGIDAAMVAINGTQSFCAGDCLYDYRTSQRKTFAHELGHFIGLAHNTDSSDIMYPDALPGGQINQLKADDATLRILTQGN